MFTTEGFRSVFYDLDHFLMAVRGFVTMVEISI